MCLSSPPSSSSDSKKEDDHVKGTAKLRDGWVERPSKTIKDKRYFTHVASRKTTREEADIPSIENDYLAQELMRVRSCVVKSCQRQEAKVKEQTETIKKLKVKEREMQVDVAHQDAHWTSLLQRQEAMEAEMKEQTNTIKQLCTSKPSTRKRVIAHL